MGSLGLDLSALPEDCIENVLLFTSPQDAIRFLAVSSLFRRAVESDAVWRNNLPPDYELILARSTDPSILTRFSYLKDLYFSLCDNPILIDDAMLSFSLDKSTGKKCYMLSARNLMIRFVDDPWTWKWTSEPECRFGEVAEFIGGCWLEIRGKISASLLSPATSYSAYLVYKLSTESYGFEHHHLYVSMKLAGAETPMRCVYLVGGSWYWEPILARPRIIGEVSWRGIGLEAPVPVVESDGPYPRERKDGWFEIELGEFYNNEGEEGEIEMSFIGIHHLGSKGGLIVQGIEIRPRERVTSLDLPTKPKEIDSAEKPLSLRRSKRVTTC